MKQKTKILRIFAALFVTLLLVTSMAACTSTDYATAYLPDYGVPSFDEAKLEKVERFYRDYYITDIPDAKDMAKSTAEIYFKDYHEKIDTGNTKEVTDAIIYSYVSAIGDDFSKYRDTAATNAYDAEIRGEFGGIGVSVTYDENAGTVTAVDVTVGGAAHEAGILVGDLITAVNGKALAAVGYDDMVANIYGEIGTTLEITVVREGVESTFTVTRKLVVVQSVTYNISTDKVGYVRIDSFNENTPAQFKEAINYLKAEGAIGIIYDLRSNRGGRLDSVLSVLSYIAPSGARLASFTNNYPPKYDNDPHSLSLPSVVICNEKTASAAELFTSAMRDFDDKYHYFSVTTVGVKTYGKGVMQNTYKLGDGSSITLTVAYYNPPSGENYHGKGITPDIVVENSGAGDPQLVAAYDSLIELLFPSTVQQLKIFGIPDFDTQKFEQVLDIFDKYYIEDLPGPRAIAKSTAVIYYNYFHDEIDTGSVQEVTDAIIESFVIAVDDPYASYYVPPAEVEEVETNILSGSLTNINANYRFDKTTGIMIVSSVTKDGGAYDAGIKAGDIIVKVDGELVSAIGCQNAVNKMKGADGTTVTLTVLRGETELSITVTRKTIVTQYVKYSINQDKIGYIDIDSFSPNAYSQFVTAIDYMKANGAVAIIYDLRDNRGGNLFAAVNILSHIAPKNTTIVSFTNGYSEPMKDNDPHSYYLPSVILCNKATASAAEIFMSAMHDFDNELNLFDVVSVGVKTYGKGMAQATYDIKDDCSITLTVSELSTLSGNIYHKIGLTPDIVIEEADAQLDEAYNQAYGLVK